MSSSGYENLSLPTDSVKHDGRRTSDTHRMVYDGSPGISGRHRSPSPVSASRRYTYDSYVPGPSSPAYRDDYPNVYRPNVWRPGRSYYSRSPSPDRYDPHRSPGVDAWGRPIPWQSSSSWPGRRPLPPSPTWDRGRRDIMAERMFEPSDTWKQNHVDRPARAEIPPLPVNRYPGNGTRGLRDMPPIERSPREISSPPYYPGGDRYRPSHPSGYGHRDSYMSARSDSYRPSYEDLDHWVPLYAEEHPPGSQKRQSTGSVPRSGSQYGENSQRAASSQRSIGGSPYVHRNSSPHARTNIVHQTHDVTREAEILPTTKEEQLQNATQSLSSENRSSPPTPVSRSPHPESVTTLEVLVNEHTMDIPVDVPDFDENSSSIASTRVGSPKGPEEVTSTVAQGPLEVAPENSTFVHGGELSNEENGIMEDSPGTQVTSLSTTVLEEPEFFKPQIEILRNVSVGEPRLEPEPATSLEIDNETREQESTTKPLESVTLQKTLETVSVMASQNQLQDSTPPQSSEPSRLPTPDVDIEKETEEPSHPPGDGLFRDETLIHLPKPLSVPEKSIIDISPDDPNRHPFGSPDMSDATSIAEALRIVVMTRLRCDRQTREERVHPVLMANLTIADSPLPPQSSSEKVFDEVTANDRLQERMDRFAITKPSLAHRFADRQSSLSEKTQRLREEYLTLHEHWLAHCAKLDIANKVGTTDDTVAPSSRTTRRSTAVLGDAVRSDLEMEQIIASLGNDELTDPNHLSLRNIAKIPDMISVTRGQVDYYFDDTNNVVDDPSELYDPQTGIHDWTEKEKEIFLEKFAAYPKQFGIIADYLPNKTPSQCVTYYYLHKKKFIDFRKVISRYTSGKRRRGGKRADKQKGNALLADIRQHDDEMSRNSSNGSASRPKRSRAGESRRVSSSRLAPSQLEITPTPTPTPDPEPETRQKRRRTAQSSRSAAQDEGEDDATDLEPKSAKKGRRSRKPKATGLAPVPVLEETAPVTVIETRFIDQSDMSGRKKQSSFNVHWSEDDKSLFLELLAQHGDDFKRIAASMPNKTTIQVSNYYKSNLIELELEKIVRGAPKRSPSPDPRRDIWKDVPQYPGSGIMSPMVGIVSPINEDSTSSAALLEAQLHSISHVLHDNHESMSEAVSSTASSLASIPNPLPEDIDASLVTT